MAGGNLAAGIGLVTSALIIHFLVAFMVSEGATTSSSALAGCDDEDNITTCQNVSNTSFLAALLQVSFEGFSGVAIVDGLYLLIVAGAFISGIVLIVAGLAGVVFGAG